MSLDQNRSFSRRPAGNHVPVKPAAVSERFAKPIAMQRQAEAAVPPTVLDT